jgi:oligoribonuclease NrnB/cAMP/cGMP phosphodiesterase (DHH superfamily)
MNKKKLWIGHIDLDGIASFILSLFFNEDYDEYKIFDYKERDTPENCEMLSEYDEIIYVDFSPSEKNVEYFKDNSNITVIDHHQTAYDFLKDFVPEPHPYNINYIYDGDHCGASLYLNYLQNKYSDKQVPNSLTEFIQLVEDYDLWRESLGVEEFEKRLDLNRLLWKSLSWGVTGLSKFQYFINSQLSKFEDATKSHYFYYKGELDKIRDSQEYEQKQLEKARKLLKVRRDERDLKFGVITLKSKISIIAHYLLLENPDLNYLIVFNTYDSSNWKVSLRSKNFNLLQLKEVSGHEHAAGTELSRRKMLRLWRGIDKYIPYIKKVR